MNTSASPGRPGSSGARERFDAPAGIFALWFGILGPPTIWLARLKLSYILVPYACWTGWTLMLHAVTVVALGLTAYAGWTAWRSWETARSAEEVDRADVLHRARFLAMLGLLSAGYFFAVIAAEGVLNFLVDPCITGGRRVKL